MLPTTDITRGHRLVRRNMCLLIIAIIDGIFCPNVDARIISRPPTGAVHGRITISSTDTPYDGALRLRGRDVAPPDVCGWFAGENGGDAGIPLSCSSPQSFCALVRSDIIGCCNPEARNVGTAACEYFTTCYPNSAVQERSTSDDRAKICTSIESECVTWAFEIDGTIGPSSFACGTAPASIVVKTTVSPQNLQAHVTVLNSPIAPSTIASAPPTSTSPTTLDRDPSSTPTNRSSDPFSTPTTTASSDPSVNTHSCDCENPGSKIAGGSIGGFFGGVLVTLLLVYRKRIASVYGCGSSTGGATRVGNESGDEFVTTGRGNAHAVDHHVQPSPPMEQNDRNGHSSHLGDGLPGVPAEPSRRGFLSGISSVPSQPELSTLGRQSLNESSDMDL